ncbi:MAG: O-antigen ligase family protein, partial [Verrucomicrobiota bacterium]
MSGAEGQESVGRRRSRSGEKRRLRRQKRQPVARLWRETDGSLAGLLLVTGLVLLGGGTLVVAQAAALLGVGLLLVWKPPQQSPGLLPGLALGAFAVAFVLGYLPLGEALHGRWREAVAALEAVALPGTVAVNLWPAAEAFVLFLAGTGFFLWSISRRVHPRELSLALWVIAAVGAAFALMIVIGGSLEWRYPLSQDKEHFTFFANRNQMANFLAITGVLSFGLTLNSLRESALRLSFGTVCTLFILGALATGTSRAGIVLFGFGAVAYAALWIWKSPDRNYKALLVAGAAVLIVGAIALSGGKAGERLLEGEDGLFGFRAAIYEDATQMVADQPLLGTGLASFGDVFGLYRSASVSERAINHPESDWLWLAAEQGLPVAVLFALAVGWVLWRFGQTAHLASYLSRVLAQVGCLVFLVHSFVDVSGHRVGSLFLALLLLGYALPWDRLAKPNALPSWVGRAGGLALIAVGAVWLTAGVANRPLHSEIFLAEQTEALNQAVERRMPAIAEEAAAAYQQVRPLDWRGYYAAGLAALETERRQPDIAAARTQLRAARLLSAPLPSVALAEAELWLPYDGVRTLSAAREMIHRSQLDLSSKSAALYRLLRRRPSLEPALDDILLSYPALRAEHMRGMPDDEQFRRWFERDLD